VFEFWRRLLSFVEVPDGVIKTPQVQGSHPERVEFLRLLRRRNRATELLLAQTQVNAGSFRYSRHLARGELFEYFFGFRVILFVESACA